MNLNVIILVLNEEKHLERCIKSLKGTADQLLVVDSFSQDKTLEIAQSYGAQILQHQWLNHATQFNWALSQLPSDTDWVLRIDADEYLTSELAQQIHKHLPHIPPDIDGVIFGRRMTFQGKLLRHGGIFPAKVLRLFRYGRGQCEQRWMDEHVKVSGPTIELQGELIDDNLNSLTWWTEKHNHYASLKRWLKESVYSRIPKGGRAVAYFFYRYIICLGFLDGYAGASFHILQGFWYRYLVDAKVAEVKRYFHQHPSQNISTAIQQVLDIDIDIERTK